MRKKDGITGRPLHRNGKSILLYYIRDSPKSKSIFEDLRGMEVFWPGCENIITRALEYIDDIFEYQGKPVALLLIEGAIDGYKKAPLFPDAVRFRAMIDAIVSVVDMASNLIVYRDDGNTWRIGHSQGLISWRKSFSETPIQIVNTTESLNRNRVGRPIWETKFVEHILEAHQLEIYLEEEDIKKPCEEDLYPPQVTVLSEWKKKNNG